MSTDGPARRGLGQGAAQEAPTAPHATPHEGRSKRTGPERFWSRRSTQIAFVLALGLSLLAHGAGLPFEWPAGLEVHDVEGEASIAVDLLQGSAADESPPPPPVEAPAPEATGRESSPVAAAASPVPPDAGVNPARPSEPRDASSDAPEDGSADGASRAPIAADAA